MKIKSNVYDLHSGFDLLNHDIPERSLFTFWHPPYADIVTYSDVMYKASEVQEKYGFDPRESDLSRIKDWDEFVKAMNFCMMKQFCALDKGGHMAVLVGDIKKKGRLYSMIFELVKPGTLVNVVIKAQHNCTSSANNYSGRFIPIMHEYLLIVKKDIPLSYQILQTRRYEADIRDMKNATWRDIVADAMQSFNAPVPLDEIYAKVDGHRRTADNRHWKEKVRQVLQRYKEMFVSTERGVWSLAKAAS